MSNIVSINRMNGVNVYLNGVSLLGRAEEANLPDVKFTQSELKALGMFGQTSFASGMEKLLAKFKWNALYPEILKQTADPFKSSKLQIRGNMEIWEGGSRVDQVPVVTYLTVRPLGTPLGSHKPQENVESETEFAVIYFKQDINNETITEVDVEANIWFVDGVDLLADYRKNLGI